MIIRIGTGTVFYSGLCFVIFTCVSSVVQYQSGTGLGRPALK